MINGIPTEKAPEFFFETLKLALTTETYIYSDFDIQTRTPLVFGPALKVDEENRIWNTLSSALARLDIPVHLMLDHRMTDYSGGENLLEESRVQLQAISDEYEHISWSEMPMAPDGVTAPSCG